MAGGLPIVRPMRPELPVDACDCHVHVYDPASGISRPADAWTLSRNAVLYQAQRDTWGTSRTVLVQPSNFGVDNRSLVKGIEQLGRRRTRGIAVLHPQVDDDTLAWLHASGVRGVRFTLANPATAVTSFEMIRPLSQRIAGLGWHVQFHGTAEQIVRHRRLLAALPCPLVIDHLARLAQPRALEHPAFALVMDWLQSGHAWIKISAPYLDATEGCGSGDVASVARAFLNAAPGRVVWGSDWPHVTHRHCLPDVRELLTTTLGWVPEAARQERLLVSNPAELYEFH